LILNAPSQKYGTAVYPIPVAHQGTYPEAKARFACVAKRTASLVPRTEEGKWVPVTLPHLLATIPYIFAIEARASVVEDVSLGGAGFNL
jgi:hypothetical protein